MNSSVLHGTLLIFLLLMIGLQVYELFRQHQSHEPQLEHIHSNFNIKHDKDHHNLRSNQTYTSSINNKSNETDSKKVELRQPHRLIAREYISKLNKKLNIIDSVKSYLNDMTQSIANSMNNSISKHDHNTVASSCPYDFKVYVYDVPHTESYISISEEARRNKTLHVCQKCILEQFALEYIIYDFFTQFCGRVYNPDEADYFYLPLVRDAEYRVQLSTGIRNRAPSRAEEALIDILEKKDSTKWRKFFNVTDDYYWARQGADHIIVMAAPVTNFRHESSMRGFFHYMIHLHTPIFLVVEYSKSFVEEYPICATKKNIVVPYPTTDPYLFNGKLLAGNISRDSLLYYAGGLHGDCIEIRRAMQQLMRNSSHIPGIIPHVKTTMAEREHGFRAATFCPVPIGDSPSSKRMYDVLNFGCIPVVLSDDLIWAFSDQTRGPIDHLDFSIHLPQAVVQFPASQILNKYKAAKTDFGILPKSGLYLYDILENALMLQGEYENGKYINPIVQILRNIPKEDVEYLQMGVEMVAPYYRYFTVNSSMDHIPTATHTFPDGKTLDLLSRELSIRKKYDIEKLRDDCIIERNQHHKYVSRYPCDKNI